MLAALLLPLLAAPAPPLQTVEIKIVTSETWSESLKPNIHAVVNSTANSLLKYFPGRKLQPILLEHGPGAPITLFQRGPNDETRIRLTSTQMYWSQYAYQFSHELTHVLCGYEKVAPNSVPNQWFEESICMMGSLFTMRKMSENWKTNPPYPNWKDYAPQFTSYTDEIINKPEHKLAPGISLAKWYEMNEEKLRREGAGAREMQSVVASVLLPMFEAAPENWPAVGYLNKKTTGYSSFDEYLDAWEESVPPKYVPFVRKIRVRFGHQ